MGRETSFRLLSVNILCRSDFRSLFRALYPQVYCATVEIKSLRASPMEGA